MTAGINKRAFCLVSALLFLVTFALSAIPAPATASGPLYRSTYPTKITYKLWQGVGNVVFCWAEIPYEMNHEIQNTDPFTGSIVGFWKGLFFSIKRLVLGIVDIVTFPIDVYGNNFQSIQRTEFPFIDEVE